MFDYTRAEKRFSAGKKYRPIGTKLTNNLWLNYEEGADRFTVSYVYSKYYTGVNELGATTHRRAGPSEREKYTMRAVAHIYKDHVRLIADPSGGGIARNFFVDMYNCTYRKAPGIKIKGMEWTLFPASAAYYDKYRGNGDLLHSSGDVLVFPDGTFRPEGQPLVRVHKKEQQNAMNRHIKAVRRMLTLRAKLGGFNSVDWPQVAKDMEGRYGRGRNVLRNFETVNKMFMEIDDEDYLTMLPVLWLAAVRNVSYYWHDPEWPQIGASYDWTSAFNRLVDSVREGLRNEQGAVEYVLDQQAQEGSEGAVGSEEASADSPIDGQA